MKNPKKRLSFLCPNCKKLLSYSESECPSCGLKSPGSFWNNNIFTRGAGVNDAILKAIFVTNIAMFVFSLLIDLKHTGFSSSPFNFLSPSNKSLFILGSTGTIPIFQFNRWWSLLSANYLHGSLLHLVFNMIAIHHIGPLLIREYGSSKMIIIFTLSGIAGFFISSMLGVQFTIGASAAVCGLIGAALYYGKSRGGAYGDAIYSQIGGWALGIFLFGFMVPGINNWGHAGGMLAGALSGYFLGYRERSREKIAHKLSSLCCVVFTGIILFWSLINGTLYLIM